MLLEVLDQGIESLGFLLLVGFQVDYACEIIMHRVTKSLLLGSFRYGLPLGEKEVFVVVH